MLFGKFRILGKLALLVLIPLLGVVGLSIPVIVIRINAATTAQDTSDAVRRATLVSSAALEIQEERLLSVGYRLGLVEQPTLVVQSAEAADAVAELLEEEEELPKRLQQAIRGAARLENTRANVLNKALDPAQIVTEFTASITPLIDGLELATHADLKTSVGRQVFALERALRSDDLISQASCYLVAAAAVGRGPNPAAATGLLSLFSQTLSEVQSNIVTSRTYFTDAQYKLYLGVQEAFSSRVSGFLEKLADNPAQALAGLKPDTLFAQLQSVTVLGGFVEKRVAKDVDIAVNESRQNALRDALLLGGGTVLLLLLVVTLSIFMARAVARPLQRLTVSADRIARAAEAELERVADDESEAAVRPIRLDAVDVEAKDEIGDLARAFDRVQTTAARLVERQVLGRRNVAMMFGHVGRRTQNLVGRQLSLIDSLERKETDSDRLRDLYRLDHMSSRLRRNASSLVVLSGGAGANEHMAPLPLTDVVRLALGEIEDYTRVEVEVPEQIVVVPAILADLTLLLAELMENATSFSPPHTNVTVTAEELRGGARLAIIDRGLGLTPERLAEENARLTRRERLDLAPTEVLGLFVVGRLARRHGIEVTLTDTPDGGVTAWVDLSPAHLIAPVESMAAAAAPAAPQFGAPQFQAPAPQFGAPQYQAPAPQFGAPQYQAPAPQFETPHSPYETQAPQYAAPAPSYAAAPAPQYQAPASVSAALRGHTTEIEPLIASSQVRSAPGSQQPFDANALSRATRTLESSGSWNAFAPSALESAPDSYAGQPVYDAEPVYSPRPAYQEPTGYQQTAAYQQPAQAQPAAYQQPGYPGAGGFPEPSASYDMGAPVAGRVPAAMPELPSAPSWSQEPAAQPSWEQPQSSWTAPVPAMEAPMPSSSPAEPVQPPAVTPPQQRGGNAPLRRRVPGSQLPAETAPKSFAAPQSQDDAAAARDAFDAFEAGISRAQWDAAETEMAAPPVAGHLPQAQWNIPQQAAPVSPASPVAPPAPPAPPAPAPSQPGSAPLTRRVPGATLPRDEPNRPTPPPAPAQPLDPEAARALMDQFEYGVALALNETQPQPEGQPR